MDNVLEGYSQFSKEKIHNYFDHSRWCKEVHCDQCDTHLDPFFITGYCFECDSPRRSLQNWIDFRAITYHQPDMHRALGFCQLRMDTLDGNVSTRDVSICECVYRRDFFTKYRLPESYRDIWNSFHFIGDIPYDPPVFFDDSFNIFEDHLNPDIETDTSVSDDEDDMEFELDIVHGNIDIEFHNIPDIDSDSDRESINSDIIPLIEDRELSSGYETDAYAELGDAEDEPFQHPDGPHNQLIDLISRSNMISPQTNINLEHLIAQLDRSRIETVVADHMTPQHIEELWESTRNQPDEPLVITCSPNSTFEEFLDELIRSLYRDPTFRDRNVLETPEGRVFGWAMMANSLTAIIIGSLGNIGIFSYVMYSMTRNLRHEQNYIAQAIAENPEEHSSDYAQLGFNHTVTMTMDPNILRVMRELTTAIPNEYEKAKNRLLSFLQTIIEVCLDAYLFESAPTEFRSVLVKTLALKWGSKAALSNHVIFNFFVKIFEAFLPMSSDSLTAQSDEPSFCSTEHTEGLFTAMSGFLYKCLIGKDHGDSFFENSRMKRITDVARALKSCETLVEYFTKFISFLFEHTKYYLAMHIPWLNIPDTPEMSATRWLKESEDFFLRLREDGPTEKTMKFDKHRMEALDVYTRGNNLLIALAGGSKSLLYTAVNNRVKQLGEILENVHALLHADGTKTKPLVLYLYGPPGTGKSTLVDSLMTAIFQVMDLGVYDKHKHKFMKALTTQYWEGYNYQPLWLIDDFFQVVDQQMRSICLGEIIGCTTEVPFPLDFAHLGSKGSKHFMSDFVLLTSNAEPSTASMKNYVESYAAFDRRIDFKIRPIPGPNIVKQVGKDIQIDTTKMPALNWDNFTFEVSHQNDVIAKNASFVDLVEMCVISRMKTMQLSAAGEYKTNIPDVSHLPRKLGLTAQMDDFKDDFFHDCIVNNTGQNSADLLADSNARHAFPNDGLLDVVGHEGIPQPNFLPPRADPNEIDDTFGARGIGTNQSWWHWLTSYTRPPVVYNDDEAHGPLYVYLRKLWGTYHRGHPITALKQLLNSESWGKALSTITERYATGGEALRHIFFLNYTWGEPFAETASRVWAIYRLLPNGIYFLTTVMREIVPQQRVFQILGLICISQPLTKMIFDGIVSMAKSILLWARTRITILADRIKFPISLFDKPDTRCVVSSYQHENGTSEHYHFCPVCFASFTHSHGAKDFDPTHEICVSCQGITGLVEEYARQLEEQPMSESRELLSRRGAGKAGGRTKRYTGKSAAKAKRAATSSLIHAVGQSVKTTYSVESDAAPSNVPILVDSTDQTIVKHFQDVTDDPNAINTIAAVLPNGGTLKVVKYNWVTSCLRIRGHVVMFPYHLIHGLPADDEYVTLCFDSSIISNVVFSVSLDKIMTIVDQDLAFVTLPRSVPIARDIVRHFISETQMKSMYPTAFMPRIVKGSNNRMALVSLLQNIKAADSDITYSINTSDESLEDITIVSGWFYSGFTLPGDCGAAILVADRTLNKKIIGVHVAGSKGSVLSGRATTVTCEQLIAYLDEFEDLDKQQYAEGDEHLLKAQFYDDRGVGDFGQSEDTFQFLGHLQTDFYQANDTVFVPSPIHGIFPVTTKPALLKTIRKEGIPYRPMYEAEHHMFTSDIHYNDTGILDSATNIVSNKINRMQVIEGIEKRLLTQDEAINGVRDYSGAATEYLGPMKLDTSPGYPFVLKMDGSHKRDFLIETEGGTRIPNLRLQRTIDDLENSLKVGLVPQSVFVECLKDEKRPNAKAEKTRVFSIPSFPLIVVIRKYFGEFLAHMMTHHVDGLASIGINPHSVSWGRLLRRLKRHPNLIAGDYSKWDKKLPYQFAMKFADVVNRWYSDSDANQAIRILLCQSVFSSIRLVAGRFIHAHRGMPSGIPFTAVGNSVINDIIIYCAALHLGVEAGYLQNIMEQWVENDMEVTTHGDDHAATVSHRLGELFNMRSFRDFLDKYLGMKYTTTDKTTDIPKFDTWENFTYLKRKFVERNGTIFAPIELDTLGSALNWMKKGCDPIKQAKEVIYVVMLEMAHYPEEEFNDMSNKIRDHCAAVGIDMEMISFPEALTAITGGMYTESTNARYIEGKFMSSMIEDEYHHIFPSSIKRNEYGHVTTLTWCPKRNAKRNGERHHGCARCKRDCLRTLFRGETERICVDCASTFTTEIPEWYFHDDIACARGDHGLNAEMDMQVNGEIAAPIDKGSHEEGNDGNKTVVFPTTMLDQASTFTNAPTTANVTRAHNPYPTVDLAGFIERMWQVWTGKWQNTDAVGYPLFHLSLPNVIFEQTAIWDKLKNFEYFSCGIRLHIKINAIQMQYGSLLVGVFPCPGSRKDEEGYMNMISMSGGQHFILPVTQSESLIVDVPWNQPKSWVRLSELGESDDATTAEYQLSTAGLVVAWILNPISSTVAAVTQCSVTVFAEPYDVQLAGYSPIQQAPPIADFTSPSISIYKTTHQILSPTFLMSKDVNFTETPRDMVHDPLEPAPTFTYTNLIPTRVDASGGIVDEANHLTTPEFHGDGTFGVGWALYWPNADTFDPGVPLYYNCQTTSALYPTMPVPRYCVFKRSTGYTITSKDTAGDTKVWAPQWATTPNSYLEFPTSSHFDFLDHTMTLGMTQEDVVGWIQNKAVPADLDFVATAGYTVVAAADVSVDNEKRKWSFKAYVTPTGDVLTGTKLHVLWPHILAEHYRYWKFVEGVPTLSAELSVEWTNILTHLRRLKNIAKAGLHAAPAVLPVLAMISPAAGAAGAVGVAGVAAGVTIAEAIGLSTPNCIEGVKNVQLKTPCMAHCTGGKSSYVLSMMPDCELLPVTDVDAGNNMLIQNIIARYGLLSSQIVSNTTTVGTVLITLPNSPYISCDHFNQELAKRKKFVTPLCFVAQCFAMWRGSITYKFQFVASSFHSARFRIGWVPTTEWNNFNHASDLVNTTSVIVDVQTTTEVEFTVQWLRDMYYLRVGPAGPSTACGFVYVTLINEIVTNSELTGDGGGIYLNTFIKGGQDMQFAKPTGRNLYSLDNTYDDDPNRPANSTSFYKYKPQLYHDLISQADDIAPSSLSQIEDGLTTGEKITSIKQLSARYGLLAALPPADIVGPYSALIINLVSSVYPVYGNALNVWWTMPSITSSSFKRYFMQIFRGWRGSTNLRYVPGAGKDNNPVFISAFQALPPKGKSLWDYYTFSASTSMPIIDGISYGQSACPNEGTQVEIATDRTGCEVNIPYFSNIAFHPHQGVKDIETELTMYGLLTNTDYFKGMNTTNARIYESAGDDFEYVMPIGPPFSVLPGPETLSWAPFPMARPDPHFLAALPK